MPAPTPTHRIRVRVITEQAWHSLFARNMFIRPPASRAGRLRSPTGPSCSCPASRPTRERDGTNSSTVIAVDIAQRLVLIAGTAYAGEIKKAIFTVLNYLLPAAGVMPMHCSANVGAVRAHGGVLRPVGHRQDHALGRRRAAR